MTYVSFANAKAMNGILATIRSLESGNNYRAKARGSTASGAYQMLDSTWRYYAAKVQGASRYRRAADAPSSMQDQVARVMIADILKRYGGQLEAIGPSWYVGRYDPNRLDYVPKPEAGNKLTVRQYQDRWLATYSRLTGARVAAPMTNASGRVAYSSYVREGARVPLDAYEAGSGKMPGSMLAPIGLANHRLHYTAAPAFINLRQAALAAGINLTLTDSYRSYAAQAEGHKRKPGIVAPPGKSMHGYGLAVDLAEGWPPKALTGRTIRWLKENAHRYGWYNSVPSESWHYVYRGGGEEVELGVAPETAVPSLRYPAVEGTEWKPAVGLEELPRDVGQEPADEKEPVDETPDAPATIRELRLRAGWATDRLTAIREQVEGTMDSNPLTREAV